MKHVSPAPAERHPLNVSRRGFLAGAGALVLSVSLPLRRAVAQAQPGPNVAAFLELRPDGTALFRSPFVEGGQGVFTALIQIVGEELDLPPDRFAVEIAPAGADYQIMGGARFTGGSASIRSSYALMRTLGASARAMLITAAAGKLGVPEADLTTEPGAVVHAATGRRLAYGDLAAAAAALPVPAEVSLRDPASFRWSRSPLPRIDVRDKSTGKARYSIDVQVEGMLLAALRHAPRLGMEPAAVTNRAEVEAMRGVHSLHLLPGAVAVVADRFWQARRAVEAAVIEWAEGTLGDWPMPADFSSQGYLDRLAATPGPGQDVETVGDAKAALASDGVISATYTAPFLLHGQLEPPSTTARFNADGTLDLWLPNQAPEMFQSAAAEVAGLEPGQVNIHSQMLGGFFGRHFLYRTANPFPQAVLLAKAVERPVKLIWTREEEFLRDAPRPLGLARFRGKVGHDGLPQALEIEVVGEGPTGRWYGAPAGSDSSAHEGLSQKPYAIANRHIAHVYVPNPAVIGYWRSVGHSMHDFFYESFLDELATAGGQDPYEMRRKLLAASPRQLTLIEAVADLSGGWKRGPFAADDGTTRARGVAMASPFGSEVATIAEVSLQDGLPVVHDIWVAIDPGVIVNPAIIEAQVQSAVALGTSQALVEGFYYENGEPTARNFDGYPILSPDLMPRVHVRIVESGAPIGGIGEPGLPGVAPAIVNALTVLTGQPLRSLPLSGQQLG
jgi:isoquinoline 1-oxidoreductase beta subunit